MRKIVLVLGVALAVAFAFGCSGKDDDKKSGSDKTETKDDKSGDKGEASAAVEHPSKEDCLNLMEHIAMIGPSGADLKAMSEEDRKAKLAELRADYERDRQVDLTQCMESDKAVNECMRNAADMPTLQACIPK